MASVLSFYMTVRFCRRREVIGIMDKSEQLRLIKARWEEGLTQEQIATELKVSIRTVRDRLALMGWKFGRGGKLEPIERVELEK